MRNTLGWEKTRTGILDVESMASAERRRRAPPILERNYPTGHRSYVLAVPAYTPSGTHAYNDEMHGPHEAIRFPHGMRDRIAEVAKANKRSMNAEIIARLEASFDATPQSDLRITLDTDGLPISWGEIHEHVAAIRRLTGSSPATLNISVFTPGRLSSSRREKEADAIRLAYRKRQLIKPTK